MQMLGENQARRTIGLAGQYNRRRACGGRTWSLLALLGTALKRQPTTSFGEGSESPGFSRGEDVNTQGEQDGAKPMIALVTHDQMLDLYSMTQYDHFLRWYSNRYHDVFFDGKPAYPKQLVDYWDNRYGRVL